MARHLNRLSTTQAKPMAEFCLQADRHPAGHNSTGSQGDYPPCGYDSGWVYDSQP